jgi:hypothetical protein
VFETVFTYTHSPVKGKPLPSFPHLSRCPSQTKLDNSGASVVPIHESDRFHSHKSGRTSPGRLPKLNFPLFDGDYPKLWISRCQDYFDLYCVEPDRWIKLATMHFSPFAGRWLQSVEKK